MGNRRVPGPCGGSRFGRTGEPHVKAGQSMWHPAGAHLVENLGDGRFELVLTELKSPAAAVR
jgi:hypothetical protein